MAQDAQLFETEFQTARPPNPIFCHTDFLEKLSRYRTQALGKRASLLMQRLAVDERRLHYKATYGPNRGWRRSRLGGAGGSHFYAWWTTRSAAPLRSGDGFAAAPDHALFLRDIRHHDDHTPLHPQSFHGDYLPLSVGDIRREEYSSGPWTQQQARFAGSRSPVRILKGHPGSGKTTALLHAADLTGAARVLYLTYSAELATLAMEHFERFCSSARQFHVATFPAFLDQLLGPATADTSDLAARKRFQQDLYAHQRALGVWSDNIPALYDEMHAHLAGDALPVAAGRFTACTQPRVPDASFRERRSRFLGSSAANQLLEAAARLERLHADSLAVRYFPQLARAWSGATALMAGRGGEFLDFDCIAVDECQDLTPLESFVITQLAVSIRDKRRSPAPVLLAGDEAQTVRPSDFEWGWLNDLFHARVGTPAEFKLSANLRSPRRIATLVNRVWDLYSHLEKKDRPSGTGLAEIEDDANDQVIYCTAAPGPDLDALVAALAAREGLALIALDEVPASLPAAVRPSVLSPPEAKGLDFHSVCVIDAGRQLERITRLNERFHPGSDIEGLRKRLAIDQLRVSLSRPAERLFWLDINPTERTVRQTLEFLNGDLHAGGVAATAPAAVLKTFEEEELDIEERIQRCQVDARQYLGVRPDLAWSRAQQAAALLGEQGTPAAIADAEVRRATYSTLAEICFALAFRNSRLAPELGRPDLFGEAGRAARSAHNGKLAAVIQAIARVHHAIGVERLPALGELAENLPRLRDAVEPWLLVEIGPRVGGWVEELERATAFGDNAAFLIDILPPFYQALGLPDAESRKERLSKRTVDLLIKAKNFRRALEVLGKSVERQHKLEAVCLEGMGELARAASAYQSAGDLEAALGCYRSIPDFPATLALIRQMGAGHPAAPSLEWIERLQQVIADRPANFTRIMKPAEKKLLETMLEHALGARRQKAPAARKPAPSKRPALKRTPRW